MGKFKHAHQMHMRSYYWWTQSLAPMWKRVVNPWWTERMLPMIIIEKKSLIKTGKQIMPHAKKAQDHFFVFIFFKKKKKKPPELPNYFLKTLPIPGRVLVFLAIICHNVYHISQFRIKFHIPLTSQWMACLPVLLLWWMILLDSCQKTQLTRYLKIRYKVLQTVWECK